MLISDWSADVCSSDLLAGVPEPRPVSTTFTLSADSPEAMARVAARHADARAIKAKLTGDLALDIERVRAIRAARPDTWLAVDGHQGFVPDQLDALIAALVEHRVALHEPPLARGDENGRASCREKVFKSVEI